MVSILKDIPIDGIKIVPCRVNGPRGIVKSFLVTGDQRLMDENLSQGRHPRMFLSGGPVPVRLDSPLNACGNNKLW